tara:strand:+ start:187 stop:498 length:312 start_codon:yes stop_codon:yes gene_type:complete
LLEENFVSQYMQRFAPQPLRYNKTRGVESGSPINYGEAKGMTFDRVLIYPHRPLLKYLKTGNLTDAGKELAKIYVAITRARQSVTFVVPDGFESGLLPFYRFD